MPSNGGRTSTTAGQRKRKLSSESIASMDQVALDEHGNEISYNGDVASAVASSSFANVRDGGMPSSHRKPVIQRQLEGKDAMRRFAQASKFAYYKQLTGHRSCINAIAFSRGQGRWLADAGDDLKIYIRDVLEGPGQATAHFPVLQLHGHESNIFSLSWSAHNKYLYSAGNDGRVLQYDIEHSPIPVLDPSQTRPERRMYSDLGILGSHHDSVPEISSHPTNPQLLLSCDDNGKLKLIDTRMSQPCVAFKGFAQAAFSSVQWNPNESDGNTFAAATASPVSGSTRLYDVRRCFSSSLNGKPLTDKSAVVNYHTDLLQNSRWFGYMSGRAETNSVCFDPSGKMLAASLSRFAPTLYAVGDPDPLALLESDPLDKSTARHAQKELKSCCTVKHGSFGFDAQLGRLHYAIGSDDFRAYVFEIPDIEILKARREFISLPDYIEQTNRDHEEQKQELAELRAYESGNGVSIEEETLAAQQAEDVDEETEILYTQGPPSHCQNVVRPVTLNKPAFVLNGAQSIVNATAFHPTLNWIATAGIENCVRLYSPAPLFFSKVHNRYISEADTTRSRTIPVTAPDLSDLQESDATETSDTSSSYTTPHPEQDRLSYDGDAFSEDELDDNEIASDSEIDSQGNNTNEDGPFHDGSVHDFLDAMRNDPLFAGPPIAQDDEEASSTEEARLPTANINGHTTQTKTPVGSDSEEWESDADFQREAKYTKFHYRHGYPALYSRHLAWAQRKQDETNMAEKRRTALFDSILHEDERQDIVDNFLACSLDLPPDTPDSP